MKTLKLVLGLLCIAFAIIMLLQSCTVLVGETMFFDEDGAAGACGTISACLMLAVGIVMIATRKGGIGGSISCVILSLISAFFVFHFTDVFPDLEIWGAWSLIIAVINFIAIFIRGKKKKEKEETHEE